MATKIQITINGREVKTEADKTILEAAQENGVEIPALCYHPDLKIKANCRICLVFIKGIPCPQTACSTIVKNGMEIITDSPEIERLRRINLELLFSQHREECSDCIWRFNCQLLKLAKRLNVKINRFPDRKINFPVYDFGCALQFDSSKCIDCRNCVEICQRQGIDYLKIKEKGHLFQVVPAKNKECIFCGQCINHCPAGAFEAVGEFERIERPLRDKNRIVVFQFAPAIRTSIGEEFGLPPGKIITEQLVAGLKAIGADKVFDVSVGADFTTMEEAKEFIEKLHNKKQGPIFSSCCPAWVRLVEIYYPEFTNNLATARPPHIILGGLIKTYWAQKNNIDPAKIKVVSIMPCVAKKYEITRKQFLVNKLKPVDYVLTTRELARLLMKNKINLATIKPEKIDDPLGIPSGGGVIYGASGGVMESVFRTAQSLLGNSKKIRLNFEAIRGMDGVKSAIASIDGQEIRMAAINGAGNARKTLEELKRKPHLYHCLEVMACPGGCIGGGGQPLPTNSQIGRQRAQGLYQIDAGGEIHSAHENPIVQKVYQEFLNNEEIIKKIGHTEYK